jgi:hypothetical protein
MPRRLQVCTLPFAAPKIAVVPPIAAGSEPRRQRGWVDGQAMLCEVKSSWHSLRPSHIADFVALARRLRPDTALLAVMDAGSGAADYLATAQEQLADEGIKFELLTTDTYMPADDPYIHFDDEG